MWGLGFRVGVEGLGFRVGVLVALDSQSGSGHFSEEHPWTEHLQH